MTAPLTLTSEDAPVAVPPFFDAMSAAGRAKLGAPDAWEWYSAEVLRPGDDILLEGGIPARPDWQRGKRGRWKGVEGQKVVVTQAELAAARTAYEVATQNCHECAGSGRCLAGWSRDTGHVVCGCKRCGATGVAPNAEVPA